MIFVIVLALNLLLSHLLSDIRRCPHPSEARSSRQATVPHHHGSHNRRRSILYGGSLHGGPTQKVTNANPGTTNPFITPLTWPRWISQRSLSPSTLATTPLGTLDNLSPSEQNVTQTVTTIMSSLLKKCKLNKFYVEKKKVKLL